MTRDDYLTSMRRALDSPHGVALDFDNWVLAERARRRFYSLRDTVRRAGNTDFDILSLVMQRGGGLLIVRRDRLPRRDTDDGLAMKSRTLRAEELPEKFGYCNYDFIVCKAKRRTRK